MATVLITGGYGFIGSHLADRLHGDGHTVVVLDDLSTGVESNLAHMMSEDEGRRVQIVRASLLDEEALRDALIDVQVVFHQAAVPSVPRSVAEPVLTHEANTTGTLALLEACRKAGVRRVVLASSSSVYGDSEVSPKHEDLPLSPLSPYAAQKAMCELYARVYSHIHKLDTVCLRYFNVFGPRQDPASQYAAAIPAFVTAMLRSESPVVYGDGEQTRDFTYIDNVVHANVLAAFSPGRLGGVALNVASGQAISVNHVVNTINRLLGTQVEPRYASARAGDVRHSLADLTRAHNVIGYTPVVDFETGIAQSISYYRSKLVESRLMQRATTQSGSFIYMPLGE